MLPISDTTDIPFGKELEIIAASSDDMLSKFNSLTENALKSYLKAENVSINASGLTSLQAALFAAGVRKGDEVICDAIFPFGIMAILNVGGTPVIADLDPTKLTMDPYSLGRLLTSKTRAVIATAVFGIPPDSSSLKKVISEYEQVVYIEDHAQAFGVEIYDEPASSRLEVACFSFHRDKPLSAGYGGAVVSKNASYDIKVRRYIELGWYPRYDSNGKFDWESSWMKREVGCQSARLPPLAAGFLLARLNKFTEKAKCHINAVAQVEEAINYYLKEVKLQKTVDGFNGQRWRTAILTPNRNYANQLLSRLRDKGAEAYCYEHPPASRWAQFSIGGNVEDEITQDILERLIVFPVMSEVDAEREIRAIEEII